MTSEAAFEDYLGAIAALEPDASFLPPLRDRHGDIRLLVHEMTAAKAAKMKVKPPIIGPELLNTLETNTWPGNVRDGVFGGYRAGAARQS